MSDAGFDRDLIEALREGDLGLVARLYADVAGMIEGEGDLDRACFFYTQGWVFALEAGDRLADELRARLIAHGRETAE